MSIFIGNQVEKVAYMSSVLFLEFLRHTPFFLWKRLWRGSKRFK